MIASVKNCFCFVAVISALCHLTDAIRCYECDSASSTACGEPFGHNELQYSLRECDGYGGGGGGFNQPQYNPNYPGQQPGFGQQGQQGFGQGQQGFPGGMGRTNTCKKTVSRFGNTLSVRRSCGGPYDNRDQCISLNGGFDCSCYGDGCNAGPKGVSASWFLTVALVAVLVVVFSR